MAEALYKDKNQSIEKRVEDLLSRMTLDEKIAQLSAVWVYEVLDDTKFSPDKAASKIGHGIGQITRIAGASNLDPESCAQIANEIQKYLIENTRLGIPAIVHEESCSGFMAKGATCFPQTIGVASTWNPELAKAIGEVIRTQMKAAGAHQALAPLLDVTRDPRWGRTEETFGEDPYLVAQMGIAYINGLQGNGLHDGIIATGKHFVGYGMSEGGMNWAPAHIPERELREVYLFAFEAAVKEAKLASIMPAYHEIDGIPCHASSRLLKDILRDEWGFEGLVVSDYFAINMLYEYHKLNPDKVLAAKKAIEAGVDIELPSTDCYGLPLKTAVERGIVSEEVINRVVARILEHKFRLGLFENPYVEPSKTKAVFDIPEQRQLARKVAQESIVLLKNENNLLPLSKDLRSIAVIGPNAHNIRHMIGDYAYPCHIETLQNMADAFDTARPQRVDLADKELFVPMVSILDGIKEKVSENTEVLYAKGCDVLGDDTSGFVEAVEAAKKADVAVVVVGDRSGLLRGCTSGEARDRADLNLTGKQEELIKAVHATGTPVVVVLVNARPLSITWLHENVPAIVEVWLPGEEGGRAVADVLFGDYNPGGKLPISFPRTVGQVPVYYAHKPSGGRSHWLGDYVECSTKPLYPFGYGLSYTTFEYSNLQITPQDVGVSGEVRIQVDVTNTGKMAGDEVVQLYVHVPAQNVTRPVKELKGFKRVNLEPGQTKTVVFELPIALLGFYDENMDFVVEPGKVDVYVGSSSEDIRATGQFNLVGEKLVIGNNKKFTTKVTVND
ncbi:glycoside hydrolase family 3 C-terminal domain-containing protein [Caldicoprobacter algeriensis]|uniref:glycoside hydrolase family 3 N-terminal domain-containing protein n=1 Tax=Caldicoprobacter algeriensis TaxID=699281 RepID=UPI00207AA3F2|nr:glycoside hydrolase family 3 N-terminal domain-containing protein [Caldicoprobacter algeriensis]MCM8899707.1 glycoside hydrolase family 3 C-terminal domain-containing protein [Caldicoprobacter algeriensis]